MEFDTEEQVLLSFNDKNNVKPNIIKNQNNLHVDQFHPWSCHTHSPLLEVYIKVINFDYQSTLQGINTKGMSNFGLRATREESK